jgi:hypothetical protein
MPTLGEIEQDLAELSGRAPSLAAALYRITTGLAATTAISDAEKQPLASVLCEIVRNLTKEPGARRKREAMDHLLHGFRHMVAPLPELSQLWAEIEPRLTS